MKHATLMTGLIAAAGLGGCAQGQFFRTGGPSASSGVVASLATQTCGRRSYDRLADVLDLEMVVNVTNDSPATVTVTPRELRLLAAGDATAPESSDPPGAIAPGATRPVSVHFLRVGDAQCNEQMALSLDRAIDAEGGPVHLRPLSFVASHSDT
jgi:hypothetical protein